MDAYLEEIKILEQENEALKVQIQKMKNNSCKCFAEEHLEQDKEFYSAKSCPNCKHNNKRQADLYLLHGKGKCWTCGADMKNFEQSKYSKQKLKELENQ